MEIGTGSKADCLVNIPGNARTPVSVGVGVGPLASSLTVTSTRATALIPSSRSIAQRPVPPLGGGAASAAGQDGGSWYPDIQPNNLFAPRFVTPGYGNPHPACGEVRFKVLCPDNPGHYTRSNKYSCHRPECPTCYPSWAARAADRAADRIEGYKSATGTPYDPRHITLSPDPYSFPFDTPSPEALQYLLDEARRVCSILGVIAVMAIPHPYRIKNEYKQIISQLADAAGINRYVWALQQDNWADLVYFSPHVHLIAYGPLMDSSKFEEKTGWVYRNHDDGAESGRSGDELKRTIYYLLTHAWVRDNNTVTRYWFGMSTRRLECRDLPSEQEPIMCPVCNTHAVKVPADVITDPGGPGKPIYQDLHNAPHAYRKIIIRIYLVRVPRARHKRISVRSLSVWGPAGPPVTT